jgi:HisJ family histidinol phosphate phosphatase
LSREGRAISDNHNHILASPIESMFESAMAKGAAAISITEHLSQFKEMRESIAFSSYHSEGRIFRDLKEYLTEFHKISDRSTHTKLRRGLEVDYISKYQKQIGEFVARERWDILLCSVHELSDKKDIEESIPENLGIKSLRSEDKWREYMAVQKEAIESDFIPFDVLAHPVRLFAGAKSFPSDLIDEMLVDLARTARRNNKALELNATDLSRNKELVLRLATACAIADCEVSFGSDAHHPSEVLKNVDLALGLVDKFHLRVKKLESKHW